MGIFTVKQIFLMAGMLVTGSIIILCKKAQNDCVVEGYKSKEHSFNHPWFQTLIFFIGQLLCLLGLPIQRRLETQSYRKTVQNGILTPQSDIEIELGPPVHPRLCQWILIIPACCTLISVTLNGIGLVYVDASIMLMLRGSNIIFAGIFSQIFLKKKLKLSQWLGIFIVVVGLVLAGCSSVFKSHHRKTSSGKTITGVIVIICSQVVTGGQVVLEEALLKRRNFHPLHVAAMYGLYGVSFMSFVVLPVLYFIPGDNVHGSFENSIDALYQISNSNRLLILCISYVASVALFTYFCLAVVKSLTAIHRTLINACRTILVWGAGLIIYYGFDKNFGEPFDKSYGLLQVDGFLFLVIGTAIYNQLLDLKNFVFCWSNSKKKNVQNGISHGTNVQTTADNGDDTDDENTKLLKENGQ